jgi:hypothetical protein
MTSYNDIRDAVIKKVKEVYPTICVSGELRQGSNRPAFYVHLISEQGQNLNVFHRQKPLLVVVYYYSDAEANARERDMWNVADELDYAFGTHLAVGNRSIFIEGTTPEIENEILQYQISLSFTDDQPIESFEVTMDDGTTEIALPDPKLNYVDGEVVPMKKLTTKGV